MKVAHAEKRGEKRSEQSGMFVEIPNPGGGTG